ncbi:hypothetical protein ISS04_03855 [Candidatus Woesearchaeota archaeon]|nr:hypothetical protein [Candidatus Woesearchaeota archaeon]
MRDKSQVKFTIRNLLPETQDYNLKGYLLICNTKGRILDSFASEIVLSRDYVELETYGKKTITLQFTYPLILEQNRKYFISLWAISPEHSHIFEITKETIQEIINHNRSNKVTISCDYYELIQEERKPLTEELEKHITEWDKQIQKGNNPLFFGGYINMIGYLKKQIPIEDERNMLSKYNIGREDLFQLYHNTISGKDIMLIDKMKREIMPKDIFRFKEFTSFTEFIKSLNKGAIKGFIKELKEGDIEGLNKEEVKLLIKLIKKTT